MVAEIPLKVCKHAASVFVLGNQNLAVRLCAQKDYRQLLQIGMYYGM